MHFSRIFYFHLISCWSILKHFLSLNTKDNTLQCFFTVPSEWTSCQARQCSVWSDPLPWWRGCCDLCVSAGCSDASDAMLALPAHPSPSASSHPLAFWAGTAEDMAGQSGEDQHQETLLCSSHESDPALGCSQHDPMTLHIKWRY